MQIAETRSFEVGPYKVQQQPRFDNPYWPVYLVTRGDRLIGKSFSIPTLSDCEWLERQVYAEPKKDDWPPKLRGLAKERKLKRLLATST